MPEVLEELQIVISTELSQFKQGMAEVRSAVESIRPAVGALGMAITTLIATGFQNVVQSADAMRDVSRVLQGLGYDAEAVGNRVQEMAESLSDATRYDDADILGAFETLLGVTQDVDTALLLWGPTLDLAAARGIDVEQAAQAIARYAKEGGGSLIKWYPFLKDAATEAERMQAITAQLGPIIGGAAARSATLKNAWEDLKKTAGDFTKVFVPDSLQGQGLIGFLNGASDAIKALGTAISAHMTPIQKELLALAGVVATLIGGPASVAALAGSLGLSGLAGSLSGLAGVLGPVGIAIGVLGTAWITNFGGIRESVAAWVPQVLGELKSLWENLKALWTAFRTEVLDPIMPVLEAIFGWVVKYLLHFVTQAIKVLADFVAIITAIVKSDWAAVWESLKSILLNVIDAILPGFKERWAAIIAYIRNDLWNDIKEAWQTLVDGARQWGSNLITGFVDGIRATIGNIKDAASDAVQAVKDFLGFSSPAKEGPGSDADKWMPNLIGMWSDQLLAGKSQIAAAVGQIAGGLNIAPQLNAFAAMGGGGGGGLVLNITGNTFRNREDIDYLRRQIEDVLDEKNRQVGRATGNWR